MAKRVVLFLVTNLLVVLTLSIILSVLGVRSYITEYGLDITHLAVFCLIWGMAGSLISLAMSRALAKWIYKIKLVNKLEQDPKIKEYVDLVFDLSKKAGLKDTPEIGIYESDDLNAFATGPTKSMALVAVSSGLLQRFNRDELAGVVGHEISHIANGDMVTMTLLQGIVNAFAMFLARVIAYAVTMGDDEDSIKGWLAYRLVTFVLELLFLILGSLLVAWFSRWREYRADAGSAKLAGRESMVRALQALETYNNDAMAQAKRRNQPLNAMMISGSDGGLLALWNSHPSLDKRINALYGPQEAGAPSSRGGLPTRDMDAPKATNKLRDSFSKREKL